MSLKSNQYIVSLFLLSFLFLLGACEKDDDKPSPASEVAELYKIQEFTQGTYTFYLYKSDTGSLKTGYNEVFIQLKNNTTGEYVEDASLSWKPLMHMADMSHACPYSSKVEKVAGYKTLYKGYFIFIMASNSSDFWEVSYYYTKGNDTIVAASNQLTVNNSSLVKFKTFRGTDSSRYVIALVKPTTPNVGANQISAYLYKIVDMFTFTPVENYTIRIDPRMPDMDNHTSPNNADLTYNTASGLYTGTVNLTMTGYWKINLVVQDVNNRVIKGETVTETSQSSTLYFEIEF
jgi:hypothetical protein